MSDATLRQVIREAQRAGRLGVLSPEAAKLLRITAERLTSAISYSGAWSWADDWDLCPGASGVRIKGPGKPEDARELGAFLAALAELL